MWRIILYSIKELFVVIRTGNTAGFKVYLWIIIRMMLYGIGYILPLYIILFGVYLVSVGEYFNGVLHIVIGAVVTQTKFFPAKVMDLMLPKKEREVLWEILTNKEEIHKIIKKDGTFSTLGVIITMHEKLHDE